jgi:hypothetical protein
LAATGTAQTALYGPGISAVVLVCSLLGDASSPKYFDDVHPRGTGRTFDRPAIAIAVRPHAVSRGTVSDRVEPSWIMLCERGTGFILQVPA